MPKYISALYTFDDEVNNLKTKVENSKNDEESKKEMLKEIELMKHKLNKSKGIPNILKKHLSKNYNGKFIIFCKDKVHLDEMKETVVDWFKQSKVTKQVDVYSVYSNYEYGNAEVEAFIDNKNPKSVKLLFSIEMFNEGIHIEDVTGVILLRPTVSPIIYYQQIGRAMQAGKSATPVIFDLVNNFDNIGAKNFVEDLEKEVKKENDKLGKDDDLEDGEEKGYVDISEFMIFDETLEAMDLFSNIETELMDNWDAMYEQLREYYRKNGNFNVSKHNNKKLHNWIHNQKANYNNNKLPSEYVNKLEEIDFIWSSFDAQWYNMYELLIQFKKQYKTMLISQKYAYFDKKLYYWTCHQRNDYKKGILEDEKINKLLQIGFIFDHDLYNWENMFNLLQQYNDQYNNIEIPHNFIFKDENLYIWARTQRLRYKKGFMSEYEISRLESLNFQWVRNAHDKNWNSFYEELINYKEKYYNLSIPRRFITENGCKLGIWVFNQRTSSKQGKMSEDKIQKLNDIGFIW